MLWVGVWSVTCGFRTRQRALGPARRELRQTRINPPPPAGERASLLREWHTRWAVWRNASRSHACGIAPKSTAEALLRCHPRRPPARRLTSLPAAARASVCLYCRFVPSAPGRSATTPCHSSATESNNNNAVEAQHGRARRARGERPCVASCVAVVVVWTAWAWAWTG